MFLLWENGQVQAFHPKPKTYHKCIRFKIPCKQYNTDECEGFLHVITIEGYKIDLNFEVYPVLISTTVCIEIQDSFWNKPIEENKILKNGTSNCLYYYEYPDKDFNEGIDIGLDYISKLRAFPKRWCERWDIPQIL